MSANPVHEKAGRSQVGSSGFWKLGQAIDAVTGRINYRMAATRIPLPPRHFWKPPSESLGAMSGETAGPGSERNNTGIFWFCGRRGRNRTCNPRIRNPMLYPFELRAPSTGVGPRKSCL